MPSGRASHDDRLLDALTSLPETSFSETVWRVVNAIRSPIDGSRGSGRWNSDNNEVLYTSLESDDALSEIHFHISRANPIFPSRLKHNLAQLTAGLAKVLDLSDPSTLTSLGIDMDRYSEILYSKTQEVGDAVAFLGIEAIIVPNARHQSNNLVIFMQNIDLDKIEIGKNTSVDWTAWRLQNNFQAKST